MTDKADDALSNDDLVPMLEQANRNLRKRLSETRENLARMTDAADECHARLERHKDLSGPDYRYRHLCSDGRVFAAPAAEAREETIRWFAGQALGGFQAEPDNPTNLRVAIAYSRKVAFALWDDLEAAFEIERAGRKAAEEKADAEQDGEGEE